MTKDEIIQYHLKNEEARYAAEKEKQKTLRYIVVALLSCLTIVACFWIYFGMPYEEEIHTVTDGSQYVSGSFIEGGNNNGSNN